MSYPATGMSCAILSWARRGCDQGQSQPQQPTWIPCITSGDMGMEHVRCKSQPLSLEKDEKLPHSYQVPTTSRTCPLPLLPVPHPGHSLRKNRVFWETQSCLASPSHLIFCSPPSQAPPPRGAPRKGGEMGAHKITVLQGLEGTSKDH